MVSDTETSVGEPPKAGTGPSADEVRAQLDRLFASEGFNASPRDRKFLRYVVDETLSGRADRIKAYSIATEVFGRDASFDAQNDPVVRIEAGRLRRALEQYYLVTGRDDPLLIDIAKGGYVPRFRWRPQPPKDASLTAVPLVTSPSPFARRARVPLVVGIAVVLACAAGIAYWKLARESTSAAISATSSGQPSGPKVVILPFVDLGELPETRIYADGLTEEILTQLARFKELTVLGRETSKSIPAGANLARLRREFGVEYVLEGSVRTSTNRIRIAGRLLDAKSGGVLWSQTYDNDFSVRDFVAIQDDVAQKVATAVAQPYGIIFRADARRAPQQPPNDLEAYTCTLRFYGYRAVLNSAGHLAVRNCLERTVARFPAYATAWAMLSLVHIDEDRVRFNPRPGARPPLERALEAAHRAVRLDPQDVRALQALMVALYFNQQPTEGRRVAEQALALNPNDTELLAEFGIRLAQTGEWKRGAALLEQALARNPGHSGFYNGSLAYCAYFERDYPRAVNLLRQANIESFPLFSFVAAVIYAQAGMQQEAAAARARFMTMLPDYFDNWELETAKRNYRPKDRAHLEDGARNAGFPVPTATTGQSAPGVKAR